MRHAGRTWRNDLLSDPRIRDNFEFWFFTYDTGNPIVYSAARLRQALRAAVQRFDPDGKDPAMHQMVLMGHSQGGLLVKLMVVDTGTKFWDNVSTVPLEQLKLSDESRQLLQESLFVEPLAVRQPRDLHVHPASGQLSGRRLAHPLDHPLYEIPGQCAQCQHRSPARERRQA